MSSRATSRAQTNGRTRPERCTCTLRGGRSHTVPVASAWPSCAGETTSDSMPTPPTLARRGSSVRPSRAGPRSARGGRARGSRCPGGRRGCCGGGNRGETAVGGALFDGGERGGVGDARSRRRPRPSRRASSSSPPPGPRPAPAGGPREDHLIDFDLDDVARSCGSVARPARIFWGIVRGGSRLVRA